MKLLFMLRKPPQTCWNLLYIGLMKRKKALLDIIINHLNGTNSYRVFNKNYEIKSIEKDKNGILKKFKSLLKWDEKKRN